MENLKRRGLSLLLALVMIVSLFAGIQLPKASAATYVYNWGERGELATELSDYAVAWYEKYNVTYADLAALSGGSSTSTAPSSALYQELQALMTNAHSYKNSYDASKDLFQYTDCQNGGGKISSFYSGKSIGPSWDGSWNREHTWPNSKGLGGQDENDIMMLRPTSSSENSTRGNAAYGPNNYDPNDESGGTYNLRGDVSRIFLYVYVRWGNTSGNGEYATWGSNGVMESLDVLLAWMEEDPVDTWELGRNDAVQSITGTRNVFVDYPELAFELFEAPIPSNYSTPSGIGGVNYTINATSSNASHGIVSVSGRTITATPAEGYYASGYTVTSGTATVTQDGNTFSVSADADCTIQINFAAKTPVTVTFMENGTVGKTVSGYAGDAAPFPTLTNTEPSGYTFLGWVSSSLSETTEKPNTIYAVGDSYTPTATTTYYALYKRSEGGNGDSQTVTFELGENTAASHGDGTSASSYSETANGYTLSVTNGSQFYTGANDASGNSAIKLGSGSNVGSFSFTVPDDVNSVIISAAQYKSSASMLTINGTTYTLTTASDDGEYTDFTVDTSTSKTVTISTTSGGKRAMINSISYVTGVAGTAYYTTQTCDHSSDNTTSVAQQDATCTEIGYTAGVQCNDCGGFISGHEVINATGHQNTTTTTVDPTCTAAGSTTVTCDDCDTTVSTTSIDATGHSYTSVVTPPTATEQGYTTYTCQNANCTYSYISDYVDALGETFTVSFRVPGGVTAIADMACNNTGITLPTPEGTPTGEHTYEFAGWVTADVNNVTDKPTTIYKAGETFTATANTTLIALYTYVVAEDGSSGSSDYVLTDLESISSADSVVITMTSGSTIYALPNNGGTSTPAATTVTVNGNKLSNTPDNTLTWNIVSTDGGYIIYPEGSTTSWLYCTNANDGVRVGTGGNDIFAIDETSGYLKNTETTNTRYVGVYTTNPDWRCYTNTTGNIANQTLGFYVRASGTTYYTTVFCEHTGGTTAVAGKDATCTEDGYAAGETCNDCGAFVSGGEVIPATGHENTTETVTKEATCNEAGSKTVTCDGCGTVISTTEIPATGNHTYVDGVCSVCGTAETTDGVNYGPLKENTAYTMYVSHKINKVNLYFVGGLDNEADGGYLKQSTVYLGDETADPVQLPAVNVFVERVEGKGIRLYYFDSNNEKYYIQVRAYPTSNNYERPRPTIVKASETAEEDLMVFTYNEEYQVYTMIINLNGEDKEVFFGSYSTYTNITTSEVSFLAAGSDDNAPIQFCAHEVTNTVTVEPTCTEDGSEKVVCEHCLAILKETVLPALGHDFVDGVCTRCGLKQLTVTYVTPAGVTPIAADTFVAGESVTLPTATGTPTGGQYEYTFVGWSTKHIDNVQNYMDVVEEGTYFDKETTQTFTDNVTLYAVYTYTIEGESSGEASTTETTTTYTFSDYTAGTQYANGEDHTLDSNTTLTINGAYLNTQVRLYNGSNAVITSQNPITSCVIKAGYKAATLTVSASTDGSSWDVIQTISTTTSYTNYTVTMPSGTAYKQIKMTSSGAQIRVSEMQLTVAESSGSSTTEDILVHTTIFTTEECKHENITTESQAATCTEDGYEKVTCNDCGTTVKYEVLTAGHTNVYTDNGDGTHTHACSVCQTVVVAAEKHIFDNTTGKCVYCGAEDTLRFHAASLTIEEGISVNFKAKSYLFGEGGLGYTEPYAVFQINGLSFKVTTYKVESDYYVFTLYNVRPDWMGENIDATLYANRDDAEQTGETKEYSIYTYCNNQLNRIVTAAEADRDLDLAKLLVDVLNYGAAAQTYTGHNTDSLVNANLGYAAGWGTTGTPAVTPVYAQTLGDGVTESATWNGAALFLRETTRVRLRFAIDDTAGVTVNATVGGVTTSIGNDKFRDAGNGNYYVFFDDLLATQMGDTITFTILRDNVVISKELTYSAESYVVSAVSAYGADSTLCQMLYAMINYGNAAEAYLVSQASAS